MARETLSLVERALADLPARQRAVVTMRDVQGFDADEVCSVLDVSPANQRVLLHRGRASLRVAWRTTTAPDGRRRARSSRPRSCARSTACARESASSLR